MEKRFLITLLSVICILTVIPGCHNTENTMADSRISVWRTTGYGGGGAMFWPAVSPHDPDYAFVACDMTGSFVTYNGGSTWRMFNLLGPVRFFVFDPVDPDVAYAKSIALFKSTDKGKTWNIVYPVPSEITGIVSKGDHAEERIITRDSSRSNVMALAVDPDNSMILHAVISVNEIPVYYTSNDQGVNWKKEKDLEQEAKNIFIVPSSPKENRTVYITCDDSVIARENGKWNTNQGPEGVKILNEFSAGYNKTDNKFILYAISGKSYFNPEGDPSGIYYTENGGRTWENRQEGLLKYCAVNSDPPEWRAVATSANNPEVLYVSYAGLRVSNDTISIGVAKSEDYGKTWSLPWKDRLTKGGDLYSPNYEKGWIDERFGPTWGENPFSIAVSPSNPEICYTTDFGRTIKTSDGGKTWEQLYSKRKEGGGWTSRGLEVTTGYSVVFDPFDIKHIFMANTDIGLMESRDGGESWISATNNNGIPRKWMNSTYWLTFDPEIKGKGWAAMSNVHDLPRPKMWRRNGVTGYEGGILSTENAAKTWNPVSRDIGESAITHIFIDPKSNKTSRTLYACAFGKGVYKSTDSGKSWIQKNNGIEGNEPFAWRIEMNPENRELFLVVCRRSDNGTIGNELDGAIYRSSDGAESWIKMDLPEGTNGPMSLVTDPDNSDRILLSAWGRVSPGQFTPDTGGGIFLSEDNGKTWKQTMVKDQHIHDITYDKRNGTFYACGFNGSAYRSEDRGKTWSRIKGYNFKWGKRVEPDPTDPEKIFIITFGGGVWYGSAKGDVYALEDIVTPVLLKEHNNL
ncbi:MAG: hypothetical protein HZB98_03770 [Bacteroidia bacterium]|nr:hypothetical protein [Bacteroidia bacterium]